MDLSKDLYGAITVLVTQAFLSVYVLLLLDFREPVRRWRKVWFCCIASVVACNIILILQFGYEETYLRVGILTVSFPYILLSTWVSKYRGPRLFFNLFTSLFIGCIGNTNGALAVAIFPQYPILKPIARGISFMLLYFLLQPFRKIYLKMLRILNRGWILLCLVPLLSFLVLVFITNHLLAAAPFTAIFIIYGFLIICGCSYGIIYLFFLKVQSEIETQAGRDLLYSQVSALTSRIETTRITEEKLRIERHDLRHRLQAVAALVERGETDAALNYIGASQIHLLELSPTRWCQNPVLDAILFSYFEQAKSEGIQVDAHLAIPDHLPVDAVELSTVFANALENAIHACMALPADKRKISCRCISSPMFVFEIVNPYAQTIIFNESGTPVAMEQGHGIGTRSIAAFAEKYGAVCNYSAENGLFQFQIAINLPK